MADSGGPGRYRGGRGLRRQYTLLNPEATLQLRSDRMKFLPYGLDDGKPAKPTRNVLTQNGATRDMPGKFAVVLHEGDTIRHDQPGGGGFGDPLERDPEAVAADVRNDKVTIDHGRREYGVVIDPLTLKVDADATRAARRAAGGTGLRP